MGKSAFGGGPSLAEANALLREALDSGTLTMTPAYGQARLTHYPDFTKQVNAGAAWLDEVLPGWDDMIDFASLDLDDHNQCVLGQTWHHYRDAHALLEKHAVTVGGIELLGDNNFSQFLLAAVSPKVAVAVPFAQAHGFALTVEAYLWNHGESERRAAVHASRRLSGTTRDRALDLTWRIEMIAREIDGELWEQLTRTWLVLIEARQTVRRTRREAVLS